MPQPLKFTTQVGGHTQEGMVLRGQKLTDLVSEANFVSTFFLSLTGRKPSSAEEKILNAILVSSIDHGISPASGFIPRVVASSGNDILTAMASALLALGPYHGGAITGCMKTLEKLSQLQKDTNNDLEKASNTLVAEYKSQKKRIPGFGHPVYKDIDPRVQVLFRMAQESGLSNTYVNRAQMIEHALEQASGRKLIINIDGGIAALLMEMGIDPLAGNALFGLARVAGSIAHIIEEQKSGQWVRRIADEDIEYTP